MNFGDYGNMSNKKFSEIERILIQIAEEKGLQHVRITWLTNFLAHRSEATAVISSDNKKINISFTEYEIQNIQNGNYQRKILNRITHSFNTSLHTGNKGPQAKPPRT